MVGPNVRLGTKWLSITSTWIQSALPIRRTSAPSAAKSAFRMLGVIWMPTASSLVAAPSGSSGVSLPSASSRSAHSSSGAMSKTWSSMSSCRSPSSANRAGIVKIVKSWGSQSSISSQRTGAETRPSGKPRTEYAAAIVWSRAFWL